MNKYSDRSLEETIIKWIAVNEDTLQVSVSIGSVNQGTVQIFLGDAEFSLVIDLSNGKPTFIESDISDSKTLDLLSLLNDKFPLCESVEEGFDMLIGKYMSLVKKKTIAHDDEDQEMKGYSDEEQKDDYGGEDQEPGWESEEDASDNYSVLVQQQVNKDLIDKAKKAAQIGISSDSRLGSVINYKSVRFFEKTKFYAQLTEAQAFLKTHENQIKGWLNLVVIKEFLTVRFEIDLNYIDLTPSNIGIFGWKITEPLQIILDANEVKLLNVLEDEFKQLDYENMWNQGMFNYQCINAGDSNSYGCNVYMRKMFEKFIDRGFKFRGSKGKSQEEQKEPKQKKGIFKSIFGGGPQVDDETLVQLVEMGFDIEMASAALKKSKGSIDDALDFLKEDHLLGKVVSRESSSHMTSSFYLPPSDNVIIQFILYMSDSLELATSSCIMCLQDLGGADSIKLRTCSEPICEYTFEEQFFQTIYSELKYNTDEAMLDITIAAKALFSSRAYQVFEPFPTFFLKNTEYRSKRGNLDEIKKAQQAKIDVAKAKKTQDQNKDLEKMMVLFQKFPNLQKIISDIESEQQLRETINSLYDQANPNDGFKAYKLLSYILATNRSTIRKLGQDELIANADIFEQYILISQDPIKEKKFEMAKKSEKSIFCWHGSSLENWYSILRNGLRNLSNTSLMTAGAAYGVGIYASSNYGTSYGYTARYSQGQKVWNTIQSNGQVGGNNFIIGIVEIINRSGYSKDANHNIVVVPEEDDIIIRYLLVLKQQYGYGANNQGEQCTTKMGLDTHYYGYIQKLNKIKSKERKQRMQEAFTKYQTRKSKQEEDQKKIENDSIEKIQKADEEQYEQEYKEKTQAMKIPQNVSQLALRRLNCEYKGLRASKEFQGMMEIDMINSSLFKWKICFDMTKYEISKELKEDFLSFEKKTGRKAALEYEITFPDSYPHSPPFVRVVSPRFAFRTGHVTVGGSICMESLTPQGWSSVRSLESQLVEILSLINAGNARLDLNALHPYTIGEAQEAFNRVAKQHGWIK